MSLGLNFFVNIVFFPGNYDFRFLDAFAQFRKATISFAVSVRPSAWNSMALTGRIFMKFDTGVFFSKICRENSSVIKILQNNGHFT